MIEVNVDNFQEIVLNSKIPVLVDFWASWCNPCKALMPILENVSKKYEGKVLIAKLNVDDNPSITRKYAIRGVPTVITFVDGKISSLGAVPGLVTEEKWDEMISSLLNT